MEKAFFRREIAWVATRENPSPDSLRSYCALEVSALEQGMFLLEVVIAGAPLVGLLGTVTGLVQVFSAMPESGSGWDLFRGNRNGSSYYDNRSCNCYSDAFCTFLSYEDH